MSDVFRVCRQIHVWRVDKDEFGFPLHPDRQQIAVSVNDDESKQPYERYYFTKQEFEVWCESVSWFFEPERV